MFQQDYRQFIQKPDYTGCRKCHFTILNIYYTTTKCVTYEKEKEKILKFHPVSSNHEQPLHAQKVTVWCGITSAKIIGPYFFDDVDGATVTVKGDNYRQMIQQYLLPQLEDLDMQNLWFQQDGATPHTSGETMAIL